MPPDILNSAYISLMKQENSNHIRIWKKQECEDGLRRARLIPYIIFAIAILIVIILFLGCDRDPVWAGIIDLSIIAKIESNNNCRAVSYKGAKYGRGFYQISEIALLDYNRENNAKIAPQSLFEPKIGELVAQWLFEARLPQILRNKGIPIASVNLLIAYNFGPGNLSKYLKGKVKLPDETRNYIQKYKELVEGKDD